MHIGDLEAIWEVVTPPRFDWIQVGVSALCNNTRVVHTLQELF